MNYRKVFLIFFIIFFSLLLGGCSKEKEITAEGQGFYMGTFVVLKASGANAETAVEQGMARIKELEEKMSVNIPDSEISQLNRAAGQTDFVPLSTDTLHTLRSGLKYAQLSQGAFDITIGPLIQAWGNFMQEAQIPAPEEIEQIKKLVNYHDLEINKKENSARLKKNGQRIDLGGIAKGYAADEVIKILKEMGIQSAFVNLGGNVVALGGKPDGSSWKVGIRNPKIQEESLIAVLTVKDKTIVTSGDYERNFEEKGVRYHHIVDPQTGYPSRSGLTSVTIVTKSSMEADALSTAAFVLGLSDGMKLIQSLDEVEGVFITTEGQIHITSGLQDSFTLTDPEGAYQCHEKK